MGLDMNFKIFISLLTMIKGFFMSEVENTGENNEQVQDPTPEQAEQVETAGEAQDPTPEQAESAGEAQDPAPAQSETEKSAEDDQPATESAAEKFQKGYEFIKKGTEILGEAAEAELIELYKKYL